MIGKGWYNVKTFRSFEVKRSEWNNRPAEVTAVTDTGFRYQYTVAPDLSDRQILRLVGRLIDHSNHGMRKKARKKEVSA